MIFQLIYKKGIAIYHLSDFSSIDSAHVMGILKGWSGAMRIVSTKLVSIMNNNKIDVDSSEYIYIYIYI